MRAAGSSLPYVPSVVEAALRNRPASAALTASTLYASDGFDPTMNMMFTRFANQVAHAAGKPLTFVLCCAAIVAWGISGPFFGFSDTWQLVINTGTTIVTFLMVFLIQNTQNRDGAAIQAKLEIGRAHV